MSRRAIVANQTGPDSYDIHYSANGADELWLTDSLETHLTEEGVDIQSIVGTEPKQMAQLDDWDLDTTDEDIVQHNAGEPAINPDPVYRGVSLEQVAYPLQFDSIEAFYLARDGQLETYVPVWMEPNVILPWRDHLSVDVYHSDDVSQDLSTYMENLESTEPIRAIDNETFTDDDWVDDRVVSDVVTKNHEAIYALQRGLIDTTPDTQTGAESADDKTPVGLLTTDAYDLQIHGSSDQEIGPSPMGSGLLVAIPNGNMSAYWHVVETANQYRVTSGSRLNECSSVGDEKLREERIRLTESLFSSYAERIAPFSPPPYGPAVTRLADSGPAT
jgi:hypothetical protein